MEKAPVSQESSPSSSPSASPSPSMSQSSPYMKSSASSPLSCHSSVIDDVDTTPMSSASKSVQKFIETSAFNLIKLSIYIVGITLIIAIPTLLALEWKAPTGNTGDESSPTFKESVNGLQDKDKNIHNYTDMANSNDVSDDQDEEEGNTLEWKAPTGNTGDESSPTFKESVNGLQDKDKNIHNYTDMANSNDVSDDQDEEEGNSVSKVLMELEKQYHEAEKDKSEILEKMWKKFTELRKEKSDDLIALRDSVKQKFKDFVEMLESIDKVEGDWKEDADIELEDVM
ncbi:hypothetical protein ADUPG1_006108 [Aduncisulcus paluster]|uniref:Transmembrane protein n=1 Tax=Aduncisulcus paluster TaxID=2918883 RepID=A0ABQ5KGU0_9EUKA|nr:hypothetical protein ADUPG1_006108 [Aduncisulcus paluster]